MADVKDGERTDSTSNGMPSEIQVSGEVPQKEKLYADIPGMPTQEAVEGIRFDFNSGLRVFFPAGDKKYHLKFQDADTGLVWYDSDVNPGTVINSVKKYYIRIRFFITRQGTGEKVFEHTLDLKNKKVVVQFPVGTIGDSIGWFSYMERFQKKHQCKLLLVVSDFVKDLFQKQYPDFEFIQKDAVKDQGMYATYYVGLFFKGNVDFQPVDFRHVGLHRTAGMILGLRTATELADIPPRLDFSAPRMIGDKYVCIATKASAQCKYWNNPLGWNTVIKFLKDNGYRVLCIDKEVVHGTGIVYNQMPWGVEDFTGNRPLQERVNLIKNADFFIGLGSGLSWLAWCCRVPVVLISGFSLPNTEFYTPYRVINYGVCNGCWDDMRCDFDHNDYFWCPRHKNDKQQYECTKLIPPEQVINVIKTIPSFKGAGK